MGGYATGGGTPSADVGFSNLSIVSATTTNANDSIKITSVNGAALGIGNPAWVDLPSVTPGQTTRFLITQDVTLNLTGAHWGFGTTGDLTGELLRVLAINDNGTLRLGVALLGTRHTLLTTDTNATATNVTAPEHVLMKTSAVGSATNSCVELGFFRSNFDDTGGAAEDLWTNQTGVNDFYTGISADGYWSPWNPGFTGFGANPSGLTTQWTQLGQNIVLRFLSSGGTSNATGFTITNLPAKSSVADVNMVLAVDNGIVLYNADALMAVASTTLTLRVAANSAGWTNLGVKYAAFILQYRPGPVASFLE